MARQCIIILTILLAEEILSAVKLKAYIHEQIYSHVLLSFTILLSKIQNYVQ